ncbi:MAG: ATP-grasp domain-containing protein [Candidatus Hydrogenedentota bacterium]
MTKRILIAGGGPNQLGFIRKAREIGVFAAVVDGDPEAPGLAEADHGEMGDIRNPAVLEVLGRAWGVDGIFPGAELAVEAAASARAALGLPGIPPETARRVRDKAAMREVLKEAGFLTPRFQIARDAADAVNAARELGFPLVIKPSDGNASKGVQTVSRMADLSPAFDRAAQASSGGVVLLEAYMEGEEYCVDGLVHEGEFHLGGITGKERSDLPYRYDLGIFMPPRLPHSHERAIEETVRAALKALGFNQGLVHAEVILEEAASLERSGGGPPGGCHIVEIAGRPGGGRIPTDLIPLVYGADFPADCIRVTLGQPPVSAPRYHRGAALYWLPGAAGIVERLEGCEEARRMPGVRDLAVGVKPGDQLGPAVDCVGRDRIGYVLTEGETADEAIQRARAARDHCRIVTRPPS